MTTGPRTELEVIGLIPAAGRATRISPSPCSKEIFPVGFRIDEKNGTVRPKVVSHYLLEKMRLAGATRAYFILRSGKWDIPAYFGDGAMLDMNVGYLMMDRPFGPPYTLDQAYPFVRNALVAFGFPDILSTPDDSFVRLLAELKTAKAEVVLGLYPARRPDQMDMVEADDTGRVRSMELKPQATGLRHAWLMALWTPAFTAFLHEHLASLDVGTGQATAKAQRELTVGHIVQAALQNGMRVHGVTFSNDTYLDIGTPEGLGKILSPGSEFSQGGNG